MGTTLFRFVRNHAFDGQARAQCMQLTAILNVNQPLSLSTAAVSNQIDVFWVLVEIVQVKCVTLSAELAECSILDVQRQRMNDCQSVLARCTRHVSVSDERSRWPSVTDTCWHFPPGVKGGGRDVPRTLAWQCRAVCTDLKCCCKSMNTCLMFAGYFTVTWHCDDLCVVCVCVCGVAAERIEHAESVVVGMDSDESNSCLHRDIHHLLQESARSLSIH